MSDTVLIDDVQGLRTITLNRPEKLNAFDAQMALGLLEALDGAAAESVRAVLIAANGKAFSAGQDLAEVAPQPGQPPPDLGTVLEHRWNPIIRAIRSLRKPVLAAVHGTVAGAGANVALCCDIVLAARSARFVQPFCKLGLVPDSGGTWLLPRLIGEARAKALAILGEPVAAEQAEAWGMIWRAVDDDKLLETARALAHRLAGEPTYGFALTKQAIHASAGSTFEAQLELEAELQRRAGASSDYAEGVRAFIEKRPPVFSGKAPREG